MTLPNSSTVTSSQTNDTACATCAKPGAEYFCAGCIGAPNSEGKPQKTAYCYTTCQKAHWKDHKPACLAFRQRKILFRAGETAQKLFYLLRRELFDKNFKKIKHEGHKMLLYEGRYENGDVLSHAKAMEKCLVPFPDNKVKKPKDKEALLAFNACTDVLVFLHLPVSLFLKGIYKDIQEVEVMAKNSKRHLQLIFVTGTPDPAKFVHQLLQVKLKCGEVYAFDISAAQYGYYEPVIPWDDYCQARVKTIQRSSPFGQAVLEKQTYVPPTGWGEALWRMNEWWSVKIAHHIIRPEMKVPITKMMKLPGHEFQVAQEDFLGDLTEYLKSLKKTFYEQGAFAFFKTQFVDQFMTLSPSELKKQREIWESPRAASHVLVL